EFSKEASRLDRLYAMTEKDCRPSVYRKVWAKADYPAYFGPEDDLFGLSSIAESGRAPASASSVRKTTLADLKKSPAAAKAMAYTLASVATPNYFRLYDQAETAR
ncbi:MAG TPA: hypothetical protein VM598_13105, partial [Bdellovibrionota bacterium]|nr:hypothetical protein [Bdellovibrionota bacterium]